MSRTKTGIGIVACCAAAWALVSAYHVEPKTAAMSGWTRRAAPCNYVSEVITCNFDSLAYVELFAGGEGNGGLYRVTAYDGVNMVAQSAEEAQSDNETWVKFDQWTLYDVFTKGKKYEFRFTRDVPDSIQYYYDLDDPYGKSGDVTRIIYQRRVKGSKIRRATGGNEARAREAGRGSLASL